MILDFWCFLNPQKLELEKLLELFPVICELWLNSKTFQKRFQKLFQVKLWTYIVGVKVHGSFNTFPSGFFIIIIPRDWSDQPGKISNRVFNLSRIHGKICLIPGKGPHGNDFNLVIIVTLKIIITDKGTWSWTLAEFFWIQNTMVKTIIDTFAWWGEICIFLKIRDWFMKDSTKVYNIG